MSMNDCSQKFDRNSRLSEISSSLSHPPDVYRQERKEILMSLSTEVALPDRPKRPLSAYNIYFRETRRKILKSLPDNTKKKSKNTLSYYSSRSPHGKIGFADLAKTIGTMWKSVDPEERKVCNALALKDKKRYDQEMVVWRSIMEKQRNGTLDAYEKVGNVVSSAIETDSDREDDAPGTQEKIQKGSSIRAASAMKEQTSEPPRTVNGTAAGPILEAIETNHDAEILMSSLMGLLANTLSYPSAEDEPVTPFRENSRKHYANTQHTALVPAPVATSHDAPNSVSGSMNMVCAFLPVNSFGTLPAQAFCLENNYGEECNEEADPFSPTITPEYTVSFSGLANHMGDENTAFFINAFQE